MIRRPPRSTHCISSAASDVYKRQKQSSLNPSNAWQAPQDRIQSQLPEQKLSNSSIMITLNQQIMKELEDQKLKNQTLQQENLTLKNLQNFGSLKSLSLDSTPKNQIRQPENENISLLTQEHDLEKVLGDYEKYMISDTYQNINKGISSSFMG
eukprot:TRINITY_DN21236_c0_g1_i1.p2 TRINITY_DN21236_c0_g1~~TRINITY_DN21236_c0_g1_i1.p2  ORF type:complete len:153 (+),score=34.46 TRINITY_DN21236_c0_g1_i1:142-600(+)